MERRPFGTTELEITVVGVGTTLRTVGERHGSTAAQVALARVGARPGVAGAIVGIRSEREAVELPGAAALRLGQDELWEIELAAP